MSFNKEYTEKNLQSAKNLLSIKSNGLNEVKKSMVIMIDKNEVSEIENKIKTMKMAIESIKILKDEIKMHETLLLKHS